MAQKVLPHLVAFVVNRGVSILIDDDAVAILYGFDNFLVTMTCNKDSGLEKSVISKCFIA
ncbi:hypothetical protein SK477_002496 [Enterobacter hormaechei]|nr:hypothetical protein [Enterobacter hormaechei subsp. xiangfangensis]ELX7456999.1 hypothetical protein [Enterobacter hormaechei subsp. hoffmannii]ELX8327790.1 hypothetical protein [Enterobacter hormaechei]ELT4014449.1 hypothetical protein [Enterobacter hormaechei subsp. xiangfangensis]ELX8388377.1 hypothetical protein [Enterobacter hormaechei]